jgi:hypothetical protein
MAFKKDLSDLAMHKNAYGNQQYIGYNKPETFSIEDKFLNENEVVHIEDNDGETHRGPGSACHNADVKGVAIKNENRKEKQNEPYTDVQEYS